jgi:hypothetical protein
VTLSHPAVFAIGLVLAVVAVSLQRRVVGLILIACAAGGPIIWLHPAKSVVAMVDLSPSTRGAGYRDRAALMHRIGELAGNVPVRLMAFSDHVEEMPGGDKLADLECDQTRYEPPAADAILLFSDGRFELPEMGTTTYPVIDPLLIDPPDAAVTEMHFEGDVPTAAVRNSGGRRTLAWSGLSETPQVWVVGSGSSIVHGNEPAGSSIGAHLDTGDPWPENDSLTLPAKDWSRAAYWWVGEGPAPAGWQSTDLPSDPAAYLDAGAIALSNVSAARLSESQQERLEQYVRDLGGSLLIFGGDHAFSAGDYGGTALDSLSPLASDPPAPTTEWMLVVDSSGSMAETLGGRSRWDAAVEAMLRLVPRLPGKDLVSVGSFARDLSWWVEGEPADVAARLAAAAPVGIGPNGPTNLQPVLEKIAGRGDRMPCEVLLLTDADTTIDDPAGLAAKLKGAKVRVSLLGLGKVPADNPVVAIVDATGGRWSASDDPADWIGSLEYLKRSVASSHLEKREVPLRFDGTVNLPGRGLDSWNRTWMKEGASELAGAEDGDERVPMGARWRVGLGQVAAFAFVPTGGESSELAKEMAGLPRDPRFKVSWECGASIKVMVDASGEAGYLNGLRLLLRMGNVAPVAINQTGPGLYALEMPAVRTPMLATLELDGHVIDRRAIPGRYAAEFDAIGNDDAALAELARRTGGRLIGPSEHKRIDFAWPAEAVRMDSYLAAAGAIGVAVGMIISRGMGESLRREDAKGGSKEMV